MNSHCYPEVGTCNGHELLYSGVEWAIHAVSTISKIGPTLKKFRPVCQIPSHKRDHELGQKGVGAHTHDSTTTLEFRPLTDEASRLFH